MVKLFVYGTLKRNFALHSWMIKSNSKFLFIGRLEDYALYHEGIPLIVREKKSSVIGEVYEIDMDFLILLDVLEGGYDREFEKIKIRNDFVYAYVYTQII